MYTPRTPPRKVVFGDEVTYEEVLNEMALWDVAKVAGFRFHYTNFMRKFAEDNAPPKKSARREVIPYDELKVGSTIWISMRGKTKKGPGARPSSGTYAVEEVGPTGIVISLAGKRSHLPLTQYLTRWFPMEKMPADYIDPIERKAMESAARRHAPPVDHDDEDADIWADPRLPQNR